MRQPKKCLHPKFVDRRKPSRTKTIISCFTRPPGQASNLVVYNKQWFMNLYKPITGPKTDKILFWFKTKMNTFRMEIASHGGNPTQRNVIVIFIGSLLIIKMKLKAFIMNFQKKYFLCWRGLVVHSDLVDLEFGEQSSPNSSNIQKPPSILGLTLILSKVCYFWPLPFSSYLRQCYDSEQPDYSNKIRCHTDKILLWMKLVLFTVR